MHARENVTYDFNLVQETSLKKKKKIYWLQKP